MSWYFEENDVIVILGDAGINYSGNPDDYNLKRDLSELSVVLFCIHGNHEMRPESILTYMYTKIKRYIRMWTGCCSVKTKPL